MYLRSFVILSNVLGSHRGAKPRQSLGAIFQHRTIYAQLSDVVFWLNPSFEQKTAQGFALSGCHHFGFPGGSPSIN